MANVTEFVPGIHYIGVNDRQKEYFEALWPLPHGVSYNSYLVVDEKVALIDTVDVCFTERFLGNIRDIIGDRPVDYLVINHMEPDHSASIRAVREVYPDIRIVGNAKALQMVEGYYGITGNTLTVAENDTLSLGGRELCFFMIPMVHWPETMVTYCAHDKLAFTGDAFGTFGTIDDGVTDRQLDLSPFWDEMVRYYSNIVGKYGGPVQKALEKFSKLPIETVCSTHGPVWTEQFPRVFEIYDKLSRYEALEDGAVIAYGSMYGNTEQTAERIARELVSAGVKNIAMHNLLKSHESYVLRDVFKYKALVIGSPTYNMQLFPPVQALLDDLELRAIPRRIFGCFGGYTWASAAVKKLTEFAGRAGWELVAPPVDVKQGYSVEKTEGCADMASAIAAKLG